MYKRYKFAPSDGMKEKSLQRWICFGLLLLGATIPNLVLMGRAKSQSIVDDSLGMEVPATYNDFLRMQVSVSSRQQSNPKDDDAFSACLLVKDDNHILVEWIAYHYEILPLRRLILAVDPGSQTSPSLIIQRWNNNISSVGLHITVWEDQDFLPKRKQGIVNSTQYERRKNHRDRQRIFMEQCMLQLRREGKTYTALVDVDEFIVFNNDWDDKTNTTDVSPFPEIGEATVMEFLRQELKRNTTSTRSPCLNVPRILFGSVESTEQERQKSVPSGYDARRFETLRFRKHASQNFKLNGLGKSIIDVSKIDESKFKVETVHRPVPSVCLPGSHPHLWYPIFRINHYLGSWERFSFRDDARDGKRRHKGLYDEQANVSAVTTDNARPWLAAFVNDLGDEMAQHLLKDVGILKWRPVPNVPTVFRVPQKRRRPTGRG